MNPNTEHHKKKSYHLDTTVTQFNAVHILT